MVDEVGHGKQSLSGSLSMSSMEQFVSMFFSEETWWGAGGWWYCSVSIFAYRGVRCVE